MFFWSLIYRPPSGGVRPEVPPYFIPETSGVKARGLISDAFGQEAAVLGRRSGGRIQM